MRSPSGTPSCQLLDWLHKPRPATLPMPISLTAYAHFAARLGAFFIEPDLFDNNLPFDNTTPIYLINLPWKLGLGP